MCVLGGLYLSYQRGLGALFDMMEGDDDGMLSWTEFEVTSFDYLSHLTYCMTVKVSLT